MDFHTFTSEFPLVGMSNIFHISFPCMGTRFDLVIPLWKQDDSLRMLIQKEFSVMEKRFSHFDPESELSRINRLASVSPQKVSQDLFHLLKESKSWFEITKGLFDPAITAIFPLWTKESEPDENILKQILGFSGYDKIVLKKEDSTVYFRNPVVRISFGAIGKGWAMRRLREILVSHGIHNALASFGDSSVLALGTHPYGEFWPVGVRDLKDDLQNAEVFQLRDNSLSTSGVSFSNSLQKGKLVGHIIHPHTGCPVNEMRILSVVADDPVKAEVLSTALFLANDEQRKEIMEKYPDIRIMEKRYDAL